MNLFRRREQEIIAKVARTVAIRAAQAMAGQHQNSFEQLPRSHTAPAMFPAENNNHCASSPFLFQFLEPPTQWQPTPWKQETNDTHLLSNYYTPTHYMPQALHYSIPSSALTWSSENQFWDQFAWEDLLYIRVVWGGLRFDHLGDGGDFHRRRKERQFSSIRPIFSSSSAYPKVSVVFVIFFSSTEQSNRFLIIWLVKRSISKRVNGGVGTEEWESCIWHNKPSRGLRRSAQTFFPHHINKIKNRGVPNTTSGKAADVSYLVSWQSCITRLILLAAEALLASPCVVPAALQVISLS